MHVDALAAPDYALSRLVLQRGLGFVYLVAFLSALNQFRPLLGERGLLPVPEFLRSVRRFRDAPSVFYFHYSDRFATATILLGILLSAVTVLGITDGGSAGVSMAIWFVMWLSYLSIVNVGQTWYSFGWESLLLEAGFLAIFLGPASSAPPLLVMLLFRWLVFRLEFGAGLIKMRGDACWRNLTCLYYHHQTQPMPNPWSWYFHRLPKRLHRVEVAANHFTQLVVPFGLFAPQPIANVAAVFIIVTQGWLLLSGNFSWLNAVTLVLACSALDNSLLSRVLQVHLDTAASLSTFGVLTSALVFITVVVLSEKPLRNMLSRRQVMNSSFNTLHLVNTYGAFGSVTKTRHEVIIEGTADAVITDATSWQEYEFKGKPGNPFRRPPQVAPYHLRLDWLMWFLALSPSYGRGWFLEFIDRLLVNDPLVLRLLRRNPFDRRPPVHVRARLYRYEFTTWSERRKTGAWWRRTLVGEFLPPVSRQ